MLRKKFKNYIEKKTGTFNQKNNKKSINLLISNNFYKIIEKKSIKFKYENRK